MTSLRDRVTVKTLANSWLFFIQLMFIRSSLCEIIALIIQIFDSFQCDEEVVNKFKFACDKILIENT